MTDVSSKNLQVRLLILVLLAFIPALGFFWYANKEMRALQLQSKEQELLQRVQVTSAEYRRFLKEGQAFLGTLAEFPEIRNAEMPTCNQRLQGILLQTPLYTTVSVIGADGYMRCGGLVPDGALYLGDRAYYIRAVSLNQFAVGEYTLGRITGKPVVGLALPLTVDGEVGGVLATSIDLEFLGVSTLRSPLPDGHTFTVLDSEGQVLVRLPATGDFTLADSVGGIAGEDFPLPPEGREAIIASGVDLDGVERLFAVSGLRGGTGEPQGFVAIGRTQATLMDEVDRVVGMQLRYLAGGAILLLALAWVLGHFWLVRGTAEASRS
jgi:hypothetical protein